MHQKHADEVSKGEDKLYEKNRTDVTQYNDATTDKVKKNLAIMERLAKAKQNKLDFEIKSIQLEEDIMAQNDLMIQIKNDNAKTRKQIGRMIHKTQNYLVNSESLLR